MYKNGNIKMSLKNFFINSNNIRKDGFLWNIIAAAATAGQAAVISVFVTRCIGVDAAGVFGIGFALGTLFSSLSKYGIRNYQVTDVNDKYSYGEYLCSRFWTVAITVVLTVILLGERYLLGQYSFEKAGTIFAICIWKQIESIEDVIYGMYQQKDRFDVASKCFAVKQIISTLLMIMGVVFLRNLFWTAIISTILCGLFVLYCYRNTHQLILYDVKVRKGNSLKILKECVALCFSATASNYICNAPKYLVDNFMDDAMQAYLGYIILPSYFIVMFSSFFFTPLVKNLGEMYEKQDVKGLQFCIYRQEKIVLFITLLIAFGSYIFGMPILKLVYGVDDIQRYKIEMIILVFAAGGYALTVFFTTVLTTLRMQKNIAISYMCGLILYLLLGREFVEEWGLFGACILFLLVNFVLAVYLYYNFFRWKCEIQDRV